MVNTELTFQESFLANYKRNSNISFDGNRDKEKKERKSLGLDKKIAIGAGAAAGIVLGDLFLAKGRAVSSLTRGKVSFIKNMSDDIDNVIKQDGYATKNRLEAFFGFPGLHAVWGHRIAHKLHEWNVPVLPRVISNINRIATGIEIHPGAKIGKNAFIDHFGAVIGETARVGNNVNIVGRVVLGGNGKKEYLRHPIVEDGVTIGINSSIIGRVTLGANSKIGAGSVITRDVPPNSSVIGIGNKAEVISINGKKVDPPVLLKEWNI